MERPVRVQRDGSGYLHSAVGDVRRRVRGDPVPGEDAYNLRMRIIWLLHGSTSSVMALPWH